MPVARPDPPLWPRGLRVLPPLLALLLFGAPSSQPSAMAWGAAARIVAAAQLRPGANSVTQRQARERLAALGFHSVRFLRKDARGLWRGLAWHAGREVAVAMDAGGRVAVLDGADAPGFFRAAGAEGQATLSATISSALIRQGT